MSVDLANITKGATNYRTDGHVVHVRDGEGRVLVICELEARNMVVGESDANASIIAEAFNVAQETGMGPRQMQERLMKAINHLRRLTEQCSGNGACYPFAEDVENAGNFLSNT